MQLTLAKLELIGIRAKLELEVVRRATHLTGNEKRLVTARLKQNRAERILSISTTAGSPAEAKVFWL
ncbi:MAG TPA: hypothetical protein DDZ51_25735 [Planctomycetaceae bacterium]|nr:hypothetical protein [Planctomycetaceae bacterium]